VSEKTNNKVDVFNLSPKQYRHWRIKALVVAEGDDYFADETLHYFLNKLQKKVEGEPNFDVNDNYVFIGLRNTYLYLMGKESTKRKNSKAYFDFVTSDSDGLDVTSEEIEEELLKKQIQDDKLYAIKRVFDTILNSFEQKLYKIHFEEGLSQREMARQSGLSLAIIHYRIKIIKNKIKDYYEKNK
jgi:DNA-directed RNA polymerase specialized sigma subunit